MKQRTRARLQEVLEQTVRRGELAGVNLLCHMNGDEVLYAQAGMADRDLGRVYQRDTISRIFSMTKPVTAAAALLLVSRGKLDLLSPVMRYLPSFANQWAFMPDGKLAPVARPVLVRELLSMTSGLVYPDNTPCGQQVAQVFDEQTERTKIGEAWTTREFVDRLAACPLAFQPGTRWQYGTSADVLGAVVEEVAGMRLSDFLQREFFAPLGMIDTGFYVPHEKQDRLSELYSGQKGALEPERGYFLAMDHWLTPCAFESGGAGLVSTVDDYRRFADMLLNRGKCPVGRLLPERVFDLLGHSQLFGPHRDSFATAWDSGAGHGYGYFCRVLEQPGAAYSLGSLGEFGWDGMAGTYFTVAPKDGLTMVMTTQRVDMGPVSVQRDVRNALFAAL